MITETDEVGEGLALPVWGAPVESVVFSHRGSPGRLFHGLVQLRRDGVAILLRQPADQAADDDGKQTHYRAGALPR